jgi:hypothetical protein
LRNADDLFTSASHHAPVHLELELTVLSVPPLIPFAGCPAGCGSPRRLLRVDGEEVPHVGVAEQAARVERDEVRLVPDVQRTKVGQLLEPLLELGVPDLRAPEHDGRDGDVGAADLGHAVHRDVEGAERGQRRAEAVPRAHDTEALAIVHLATSSRTAARSWSCALYCEKGDRSSLDV